MKNFKLLALIFMGILYIESTKATPKEQTEAERSLTAYLYSYFRNAESEPSIPAAENCHKKVIIFDLDGVLCKTNDLQAFYEIGMRVILEYLILYGKPSTERLFKTLENTPAVTTFDSFNEGLRMPQIMVDWQTNAQELRDIQDSMIKHILSLKISITEKNFFINTVLMMTTPEKFVATRQIILQAIELVRELKDLGYRIYILSNWDAPSFGLFQEKFPELFIYNDKQLFDGIMISGKTGLLKPSKEIFELCLKKFNIKISHAVFIDDTIENIQAAQNLHITSIQCKNKDIAKVKKDLADILNK